VPFAEPSDVAAAIAAAKAAFPKWRDAGPDFRSGILLRAAALLHQRAEEIGRVMTLEEGQAARRGHRRGATGRRPGCSGTPRRGAAPTGGSSRRGPMRCCPFG